MVFKHRSIPLTVSLKRQEERAAGDDGKEFLRLLGTIKLSLSKSEISPNVLDEAWDYDYDNLWEERFGRRRFPDCTLPQQIEILRRRTYWYRRLKKNNKTIVRNLLAKGRKGALQLKEILHCVDGTISSLIVSFPECLFVSDDPSRAYTASDAIINNIISNCLFDYKGYQTRWKKFKKGLKKAAFERVEYHPPSNMVRNMSWVMGVVNTYNTMASENSKAKMFRVCAFTQTRATGLANNAMVESTINEFIDEVSRVKEFSPDPTLELAVEFVTDQIAMNAAGPCSHFRVSMSTSACTESSKRSEGKFGHLKRRFRRGDFPPIKDFGPDNEGGQIGNQVFSEARRRIRSSDPALWRTNVAGIRENGKCRVVTSGSFYKDALLQPFSHLTIESIKSDPLLRDSLQAGNLGYKFISRLTHLDHERGAILFEKDVSVLSFDWVKSTDRPSHKSAHFIMSRLLKKMRVPDDVLEDILSIWPGRKDLYRNGRYICDLRNGIPMGDPLTKTNLSLAHPIAACYADMKVGRKPIRVGAGNGDDGVEIVSGPDRFEWMKYFMEATASLGYDISEDDTFITSDWFTYCEEVATIPIDRFHTTANASRLREGSLMPYLDVPKFRLIIDTRKDRPDFSSDPRGKATLLGKSCEYVRHQKQTGVRHLFAVASACQDVCLGLRYMRTPMYLPRQVFGIGKPDPNWNTSGWARAIMSQNKFSRDVSYTVLREFNKKRSAVLIGLKGVLSNGTHFDHESYVEIKTIPADDPIKKYRVVSEEQWKLFPEGVLERLIEMNRLVPETKISALYLFQERIKSLTQDIPRSDLFEVIKAMSIPLDEATESRLVRELTEFKILYGDRTYALEFSRPQDLYPATVMEVLRRSDPLRVDLEGFDYINRFTSRPKADGPLERGVDALEDWFWNNVDDLKEGGFVDLPPTDVIQDDPIILLQAHRAPEDHIIVITNDKKLVRLMANRLLNKSIYRISVETWVNHDADEGSFKRVTDAIWGPSVYIVDQGALETFLLKTDIDTSSYPGWSDSFDRRKPPSQADIYDVYLAPRVITESNIGELVKRVPRGR